MCLILVKDVLPRIQTLFHAGCIDAEKKNKLVSLIREARDKKEIGDFIVYLETIRLDIPEKFQDVVEEIYSFCRQY